MLKVFKSELIIEQKFGCKVSRVGFDKMRINLDSRKFANAKFEFFKNI